MIRKLALSLSLSAAFGASLVHALGLGEAKVKSSLNQPLNAEIELVNVRELENNEILPGLASREDFQRSGVERVYFLSDIRFQVTKKKDGKTVVELTTKKPVREPFLNFLVEVIWPSGRLLREYALLIDPPLFDDSKSQPVLAAKSFVKPSTRQADPVETQSAVAKESYSTRTQADSQKTPSTQNTYGPTTRSDTLWKIALDVRPNKSVTPQQTMLAIQDLNPDAFIDENINQLKSGQVLRVPDLEDIRARSKRQAVRDVIAQNKAFDEIKAGRKPISGKTSVATTPKARAPEGDELKLVVATPKDKTAPSQTHAGESVGGGQNAIVEKDVAVTLEQLDKANIENRELNDRVQELEEQLQTIQRLLTLKDDQLASLQNELGEAESESVSLPQDAPIKTAADVAVADVVSEKSVTEGTVKSAEMPAAEEAKTEQIKPADVVEKDGKEAVKPIADEKKAEVSSSAAKPVSAGDQDDVFQQILNNPIYQLALGVGVILLALILWLVSKANAKREQEYYEKLNESSEDVDFETDAEEVFEEEETQEQILGASTAAASNKGKSVDGEAEDPVASADIYIAYGRTEQAIEVLENAISAQPARSDLRLKLLEIYAQQEDFSNFDAQYEELKALDDAYALDQADKIRLDMDSDAISIDDLESQLLSSSDAVEVTPEPSETEEIEDEAITDTFEDLDKLEIDLKGKGNVPAREIDDDDLDIDFDISDLDLDVPADTESGYVDQSLNANILTSKSGVSSSDTESELSLELDDEGLVSEEEVEPEVDESLSLDLDVDGSSDLIDESLLSDELVALEQEDELSAEDNEAEETEFDLDLEDLGDLGGESADELLASIDQDLGLDDLDDETVDDQDDLSLTDMQDELQSIEDTLSSDIQMEELDESDLQVVEDLALDVEDDSVLSEMDAELDASDFDDTLLEEAESSLQVETPVKDESLDDLDEDEFDFLSGTDEAATKLDLARAYIDMGDVEGARDILEEVTIEGSDEQQKEATALLKSIE